LDGEVAELRRRFQSLTRREAQVMALVVAGRLNKQSAGELGISETTVKVHRMNAMRKMKVRSVPDLVRIASRIGAGG
jgi:FixJ family two-component response regulator